MKKALVLTIIMLISGCTQSKPSSTLSILSMSPENNTAITNNDLINLSLDYEIGGYDYSKEYFVRAVLVSDEATAIVVSDDFSVLNNKGITTLMFNPQILGEQSPYVYRVGLYENLTMSSELLASAIIEYN